MLITLLTREEILPPDPYEYSISLEKRTMKQFVLLILISGIMALCGCTTEKAPVPQQQISAISLTTADKEKLLAFQKEILNIENLTDKAVKLAAMN